MNPYKKYAEDKVKDFILEVNELLENETINNLNTILSDKLNFYRGDFNQVCLEQTFGDISVLEYHEYSKIYSQAQYYMEQVLLGN